jgi:FkbH-like protein
VTTSLEAELDDMRSSLDAGLRDAGDALLAIAGLQARLGDDTAALTTLRRFVLTDRTYRRWERAARLCRSLQDRGGMTSAATRVAVIGTSTLDQLGPLVEVACLAADLTVTTHVSGIGQYETAALDPASGLRRFAPDAVVLAPDAGAVTLPTLPSDPDAVVSHELARWTAVWGAIRAHSDAHLLQLNFVPLAGRPLGSLEAVLPSSRRRLFAELNRQLAVAAKDANVSIVDVDGVAAAYGLDRWRDDRYWYHAKQAVALGALPLLASEIAAVLRSRLGATRKVLVTDLDNTLWGGVVGDDGVAGLELAGSPIGEAHLAVQSHLLDLKARGVLLAVCSKNDPEIARSAFTEREDMLLSPSDFAAFVASWAPKPEGIRKIAEELNLGLDAFVFLDDNPAEREIVRQQLPQVDVIDLPLDASGYRRALVDYRGFEVADVTAEDVARTDQYLARAAAADLLASATNLEEYLRSLLMRADVRPFDDATLPRVHQLIGKTNQWNLTTRRHTLETLQGFATDDAVLAVSLRLTDRFVDHGIVAIAIAIARPVDDALEIDSLLMSCRVIGRTVERTLMDLLVAGARERGLRYLRGVYRRTQKNGLVADLYPEFGFVLEHETDDVQVWVRDIGAVAEPENPLIDRRDARR